MSRIRLLFILCLAVFTQGLWAGEVRLHKDRSGGDWLELPDYQLWLPVQSGWTWQRQDRSGFLTLEVRAPKGVAGIMLWGGDLGRRLEWRQLAQVWRERSAALGNLAELVDTPSPPVATGVDGVNIQYQTWFGRVANQPSLTRVGYLVDAERAFVLMGIWLAGDSEAAKSINRQLEGLRLRRPDAVAETGPASKAALPSQEARVMPQTEASQPLPLALPPPLDLPAAEPQAATSTPLQANSQSPLQSLGSRVPDAQFPIPQLPDPAQTPGVPLKSPPLPQLRAPLPERPLIRQLRLQQAQSDAGHQQPLSRWQGRLDFSAQVFNLPPGTHLEALWLLQAEQLPEVVARRLIQTGSDSLAFHLDAPQGFFAAGDYRLELRLSDQLLAALEYSLRDPSEAELLTLAEQGDAKAQLGLYAYLEMGRLVRLSEAEALDWLDKAASQGLPLAQYQRGLLALEGRRGQPKDAAKAMGQFRAAAEQGLAEAAHALAMGYRQGRGLETDLQQAFAWSKKAVELGYGPSVFFLGMHYLLGRGVEADRQEARRWLGKAASQGDANAAEVLRELDVLDQGLDGKDDEASLVPEAKLK